MILSTFIILSLFPTLLSENIHVDANEPPISSIEWNNITVSIRSRRILTFGPGKFYSGRLTGVIGPSGSGKTTFLKILSSRIASKSGLKINADVITSFHNTNNVQKSDIAFVNQIDAFFGMLTVKETLMMASGLNWANIDSELQKKKIDHMLQALNLNLVADSFVGDDLNEGISGGEKKRLSVGCQLLASPKLLIADEPTSGLDSFQALHLVEILRNISANKNIITIATIHQPSSYIWSLLDDVLILTSTGRVGYLGERRNALPYFESIGYFCPNQTNPAEFLLDLVSYNMYGVESLITSINRIHHIEESFYNYTLQSKESHHYSRSNMTTITTTTTNNTLNSYTEKILVISDNKFKLNIVPKILVKTFTNNIITPIQVEFSRFLLLFQRAIKQSLRDTKTNVVRMIVSGLLANFVGMSFGSSTGEITVAETVTVIAHTCINIAMISSVKALDAFKKERLVVERERIQGQYSSLHYLFAKLAAELPIDGAVAGVFSWILHYRAKLRSDRFSFVKIGMLLGMVSSSFGLATGALFPMGTISLSVGTAINVIYIITGAIGPITSGKPLPAYLQFIKRINPIRIGCETLCALEFYHKHYDLSTEENNNIGMIQKMKRMLQFLPSIILSKLFPFLRRKHAPNESNINEPLQTTGDHILESLGIAGVTVFKGVKALVMLICFHSILAFSGLEFMKPKFYKMNYHKKRNNGNDDNNNNNNNNNNQH